jgi:hypothetical protein
VKRGGRRWWPEMGKRERKGRPREEEGRKKERKEGGRREVGRDEIKEIFKGQFPVFTRKWLTLRD